MRKFSVFALRPHVCSAVAVVVLALTVANLELQIAWLEHLLHGAPLVAAA